MIFLSSFHLSSLCLSPFSLLCRDLAAFDKSHDQAVRAYQEHKASMHPVTAMLVGKDLKVD